MVDCGSFVQRLYSGFLKKQKGGTSSAPPFSLRFRGSEKTGRNRGKNIAKKNFSKWKLFTGRYKHHVIPPVNILNSHSPLVQYVIEVAFAGFRSSFENILPCLLFQIHLELGIWNFSGAWSLGFGAFLTPLTSPRA